MIDLLIAWYALGWATAGLWKFRYPSRDVAVFEVIPSILFAPVWFVCQLLALIKFPTIRNKNKQYL